MLFPLQSSFKRHGTHHPMQLCSAFTAPSRGAASSKQSVTFHRQARVQRGKSSRERRQRTPSALDDPRDRRVRGRLDRDGLARRQPQRLRLGARRVVPSSGSSASTATRPTDLPAASPAGAPGLIGVTVPRIHPSYFSLIVAGVADALYEHDMRIVLCPTLHEHDREVSLLERLVHGTTDGGLLVLPEESSSELRTLMHRRLSLRRRRPAQADRR